MAHGHFYCLSRTLLAVIVGIEAGIVQRAVDPNPIRLIDAPPVSTGRTDRKRGSDLDPAVLLQRDQANLIRDFREVLILAEDQRYVVLLAVRQVERVQRQPDIDPLLFGDEKRLGFPV